ncbi:MULTISPECIES: hypothetical protein [unclassified Streptomyces]|uniref:hypothetical protein n=1 Tax=unclassified Streptomyces TaxID=2593676 RepID=UPI003323DF00
MFGFTRFPVRYRSQGGAIVTVDSFKAYCDGCGDTNYRAENERLKWAQTHADKCRALPRH